MFAFRQLSCPKIRQRTRQQRRIQVCEVHTELTKDKSMLTALKAEEPQSHQGPSQATRRQSGVASKTCPCFQEQK